MPPSSQVQAPKGWELYYSSERNRWSTFQFPFHQSSYSDFRLLQEIPNIWPCGKACACWWQLEPGSPGIPLAPRPGYGQTIFQKARSPDLATVARELALDQALEDYEFTLLSHIDTKSNVLADALSRQFEDSPEPFPPELAKCKRVAVKISPSFWRVKQGKYSKSGGKMQQGRQPLGSEYHDRS